MDATFVTDVQTTVYMYVCNLDEKHDDDRNGEEEGKKGIDDHQSEPTEEGSRKPMPTDAVCSECQS